MTIHRREILIGTVATAIAGPAPRGDIIYDASHIDWLDGWVLGVRYRDLIEASKRLDAITEGRS
jgi:hypothetical protein